jgi:hypothetical protein
MTKAKFFGVLGTIFVVAGVIVAVFRGCGS